MDIREACQVVDEMKLDDLPEIESEAIQEVLRVAIAFRDFKEALN